MANEKPARKIPGTLELVEGMLSVANMVSTSGERDYLQAVVRDPCAMPCSKAKRRKLGRYQGRVVLAALAAELALKFAWERHPGNECKAAPHPAGGHHLEKLFDQLCPNLKQEIENQYSAVKYQTENKNTARKAFGQYEKPFEEFRYIGEYPPSADDPMRATDLILATESVISAVRKMYESG